MKIASLNYSAVEQELFPLATQASEYMDRLFPAGKLAEVKGFLLSCTHLELFQAFQIPLYACKHFMIMIGIVAWTNATTN